MRLKRLELYGYKSFATRSIFEFSEGITAVVGPNGSGKSNIADAIRWVMGEQSFSSLRAKTTEDMIFAGSRGRARLGMAEVLIVLDNAEGWLPLDYTEVAIGRRAYRSGENEYLLNGVRVRYRDVLDVLGGAGLMRSNYTVIGQGMVDAALALRPEARRTLFEEAAGVTPHLRKRTEALSRIAETERNLERVNDILNELRPRASSLRRQAERAEEYTLLRQDLTELQRIWYGYQWQRRQRQMAQAEEHLKEQAARLEAQKSYMRGFQDKLDQLVAQQAIRQKTVETLNTEQSRLRDTAETMRREMAVTTERARLYQQQCEALAAELEALASRQGILQSEIEHTTQELAEQETAFAASRIELEVARNKLTETDAVRRNVEKQIALQELQASQYAATVSDVRARLDQAAERRQELNREYEETEAALAALQERRQSLQAQGAHLAEREAALLRTQTESQQRQTQVDKEIIATREQIAIAEEAAARVRAERDRIVARREAISRVRQELTGYYPGVREVLSAEAKLSGLLGTVANLMQVPQDLEQAIESALGPRLQNIVAERWEDAESAIAHLKRTHAGWATFLPLDTVRSHAAITLRAEPGVVGVASTLVRFEERLRPVFDLLLGNIAITQDLPTARRLLERRTGAALFVTLAGDTVQPSGALSGGTRREASNLLAQEREWRDLPKRIGVIEGELAEALRTYSIQQSYLADLQRQVKEHERQMARARAERDAAHAAVANHTQEMRELEREGTWRTSRQEQGARELHDLAQREQRLRERLVEAQRGQVAAMEQLRILRAHLMAAGDEGLRHKVGELETRTAVAQRTVHSQRTLLESHRRNFEQLSRQIHDKRLQEAHLRDELQKLEQTRQSMGVSLAENEKHMVDVRQRSEPTRAELTRLERERRDLERQRAAGIERLNEAELELNRITLERDRTRDEQAALTHEIEGDLGPIDLPETVSHQLRLDLGDDIVELPLVANLPPGLTEEIQQLKARLRRLGDVNPNAPQEYQQLLERQTFLQGQESDLRGAIAALHEVIQELDTLIERDLSQTIERVDKAFGEYFSTLFGGGSARLVLTDPESISTTGIDIIAHPPGKRAQSLSLLSGGERALTAGALLFALLRANPVPFCFLDEVDAALDEANVSRFRDLLRDMARTIQFVVITHNRRTIEAAATIYGISMGEQGVSQSISLKLEAQTWSAEPTQLEGGLASAG